MRGEGPRVCCDRDWLWHFPHKPTLGLELTGAAYQVTMSRRGLQPLENCRWAGSGGLQTPRCSRRGLGLQAVEVRHCSSSILDGDTWDEAPLRDVGCGGDNGRGDGWKVVADADGEVDLRNGVS